MIELDVELSSTDEPMNVSIAESFGGSGTKNYNALNNKPSINNVELTGNLTASELGLLGDDTAIPTKISDLINDSSFLTSEVDPTVPAWAKTAQKPQYTSSEVGIIANPDGEATVSLTKIKIGDVIYSVEGGSSYTNIEDSEEEF